MVGSPGWGANGAAGGAVKGFTAQTGPHARVYRAEAAAEAGFAAYTAQCWPDPPTTIVTGFSRIGQNAGRRGFVSKGGLDAGGACPIETRRGANGAMRSRQARIALPIGADDGPHMTTIPQ